MQPSDPAFFYSATRKVLEDAGRMGIPLQGRVVMAACTEAACFFASHNFDSEARDAKLKELEHDFTTVVARADFTVMVLTWDGAAVRLFLSDDPERIAATLSDADAAGHGCIPIAPHRLAAWCLGLEVPADATRH